VPRTETNGFGIWLRFRVKVDKTADLVHRWESQGYLLGLDVLTPLKVPIIFEHQSESIDLQ
jgi:hypothetical protein